jgi:hypothetical protein
MTTNTESPRQMLLKKLYFFLWRSSVSILQLSELFRILRPYTPGIFLLNFQNSNASLLPSLALQIVQTLQFLESYVDKPPEIVFYANDTPDTLRMSSKVRLRIEITLQLTVLLVRLRYDSKN